jgi:hypothetical protein
MENEMLSRRDIFIGVAAGVLVGSFLTAGLVIGVAAVAMYFDERSSKPTSAPPEPEPEILEIQLTKRYDVILQHDDGAIRELPGCMLLGRAAPSDVPRDKRRFANWTAWELEGGLMVYFRPDDLVGLEESTPSESIRSSD